MLDSISHAQVRGSFACLSLTSCSPPPFSFFSFWLLLPSHRWQFTPFNSHYLSFSFNISFLWTPRISLLLSAFSLHKSIGSLFYAFPLSFSPILLSQYLYAAPLCNTSLIHTLLHPPSPPFRSHTINAEKRAQTEVTCTEHIKEVCLNKSRNV